MYRRFGKRLLDIVVAALCLALLWPVFLLTSCTIRLEDGGPAIFRQQRVGRDGKLFTLFKFRSMPVDSKDVPSAQARSLRVTRVGAVIRRLNIDELPQLINILRGEMSLVGPRPALPSQTSLRAMRDAKGVASCTPGLTGLAQVHAYDGMSEAEKVEWDAKYARSVSFLVDAGIILRTFAYLLKPPPVY